MKLLLIRHGDPDYTIDSLTSRGWREAELLADRLAKENITAFYQSPLGRARDTASKTLERTGRTAESLDWLCEFSPRMIDPDTGKNRVLWDWLPQRWTEQAAYYEKERWYSTSEMEKAGAVEEYHRVCEGLDQLLAQHGYERDRNLYHVIRPNHDTLAFFCHFGVSCVILSHLIGVSPMVLWHGACALTSSVTSIVTEERRKGIASFRILSYGDVSHLINAGVEPSFSARFCETFDDAQDRHD